HGAVRAPSTERSPGNEHGEPQAVLDRSQSAATWFEYTVVGGPEQSRLAGGRARSIDGKHHAHRGAFDLFAPAAIALRLIVRQRRDVDVAPLGEGDGVCVFVLGVDDGPTRRAEM